MQKKLKRGLIATGVSLVVVTVVLVLLGLARVNLNENALNYSVITANYSDGNLYGPGLYWIGIANRFLRFNKNQQTLRFPNLRTYSSDFYQLTANIEATLQFQTNDSFANAASFLQLFGETPLDIVEPLIRNEILVVLSSKNSSYYQKANSGLESELAGQVTLVLQRWIQTKVIFIVESVICEGTTSNTEMVDREIQSLLNDLQRATQEKVELTDYFTAVASNKKQEIGNALTALTLKAQQLDRLYNASGNNYNLSKLVYNNKPLKYNLNLVDMLEQMAVMANRTFPY